MQCPEEHIRRSSITGVIKSLVLVLKASNSLQACAQWYSSQLQSTFVRLTTSAGPEGFQVPEGIDRRRASFPKYLKRISIRLNANIPEG